MFILAQKSTAKKQGRMWNISLSSFFFFYLFKENKNVSWLYNSNFNAVNFCSLKSPVKYQHLS